MVTDLRIPNTKSLTLGRLESELRDIPSQVQRHATCLPRRPMSQSRVVPFQTPRNSPRSSPSPKPSPKPSPSLSRANKVHILETEHPASMNALGPIIDDIYDKLTNHH